MLDRILIGLAGIIVGAMVVMKSEWFLSNLGSVQWAEEKLGTEGGSRLFYKLIGLAIIFFGIFVMTGITTDIMNGFAKMIGL